ncbi:hypothetical protein VNI00_011184 [Paramarasmius palmivorus]|uniref:EF-hand domain-containing protein n=1 Tax=Paramarasmius palmivorus TaxID=297713 RepID=A0AAW0CHM1_9AGAR
MPTFFNAVNDNMMSLTDCWINVSDSFAAIRTTNAMSTSMKARLTACGMICALSLIHLNALPPMVTPALFEAIAHGEASVDDASWVGTFHSTAKHRLEIWPTDSDNLANFDPDPMKEAIIADWGCQAGVLISVVFSVFIDCRYNQLKDVRLWSRDARASLRRQVVASATLGMIPASISFNESSAVKHFRDGFNIKVGATPLLSPNIFGKNSKNMLLSLSQLHPKSGSDILPFLKWMTAGHKELEGRFKACFVRYINGQGHVTHDDLLETLAPPHERELYKDDSGFRARRFLRCLTGDETLPRRGVQIEACMKFAPPPPPPPPPRPPLTPLPEESQNDSQVSNSQRSQPQPRSPPVRSFSPEHVITIMILKILRAYTYLLYGHALRVARYRYLETFKN